MLPWGGSRDIQIPGVLSSLEQQQPLAQHQQSGETMYGGGAGAGRGAVTGQQGQAGVGQGGGGFGGGFGGGMGQQGQGQMQQQQQGEPQGPMQGAGGGQPNNAFGGPQPPPGANGPPPAPISLPQVLHYLQSTHRSHLSMQNSWEIERAELRARVALLEGEKRSWEQAKTDLARRIRMLEWALKVERSKYLSQPQGKDAGPAGAPPLAAGKVAALKAAEGGSTSGLDSPARADSPKLDESALAGPVAAANDPAVPAISVNPPAPGVAAPTKPGDKAAAAAAPAAQAGTWAGATTGALAMGTMVGAGRDPKARARSREYLKQCLQEINYLTSNAALNPLPQQAALIPGFERPRKVLADPSAAPNANAPPRPNGQSAQAGGASMIPRPTGNTAFPGFEGQRLAALAASGENTIPAATSGSQPTAAAMQRSRSSSRPLGPISQLSMASTPGASNAFPASASVTPTPEPSVDGGSLPNGIFQAHDAEATSEAAPSEGASTVMSNGVVASGATASDAVAGPFDDADEPSRLTAIYRPESSESWREQLRQAGEKEKERLSKLSAMAKEKTMVDEELAALSLSEHEGQKGEAGSMKGANGSAIGTKDGEAAAAGHQKWKAKRVLRSHLDAARCIAFDRAGLTLASGSDDCTVKLWRLNAAQLSSTARASTWPETEPQLTLRGHSSTVTSVAISTAQGRIYSASLDSTVQVWTLPPADHDTYAPYDPRMLLGTFVGHTDGIWDMALLPLRFRDEALLATASADGTVKVWSTDELGSPLKLSWTYDGTDADDVPAGSEATEEPKEEGDRRTSEGKPVPTSIAVVWTDLKKVAVAYSNSIIKLFELETGKAVLTLKSDETYDGTPATQVNKIVTHFTMPILISAHEDRYIRVFDLNTGACTHSMLGHLDAVTSLAVDPSGLSLVSGGHDCSIRFWDLASRTCVQEVSSHRTKANEGVTDVAYHPSLPFMASAGADGTVKIFG